MAAEMSGQIMKAECKADLPVANVGRPAANSGNPRCRLHRCHRRTASITLSSRARLEAARCGELARVSPTRRHSLAGTPATRKQGRQFAARCGPSSTHLPIWPTAAPSSRSPGAGLIVSPQPRLQPGDTRAPVKRERPLGPIDRSPRRPGRARARARNPASANRLSSWAAVAL